MTDRRTDSSTAVVGDDVVDELLFDLGLDGDQVGAVVSATAYGRLGQLQTAPVDDVTRPDTVQAGQRVIRTEPGLNLR